MGLKAVALSRSFGCLQVLDSVDLECHNGQVTALVGANGAGKTTLFKILLGLLRADSGKLEANGGGAVEINGFVEKPSFYSYLSAAENISLFARLSGLRLNQIQIQEQLEMVGLDPARKDPVRNFSMGMKQRLGIAISLLNDPDTLILDEPFSGLDPIGTRALSELLTRLAREKNKAVLISSHYMDQLIRFCDIFYVIKNGRILLVSSAAQLIADHTVGYNIQGANLDQSRMLQDLGIGCDAHSVYVDARTFKEFNILSGLTGEGYRISACIPVLQMDALFENQQ